MAKGGSDWFSYKEKHYMVTSDYPSGFFEIDLISTGDSKTTSHGKYDPYLGLFNLHNTSAAGLNCSPSQLLLGRHNKTQLPPTSRMLKSNIVPSLEKQVHQKDNMKINVASRVNSTLRNLKPLQCGDVVCIELYQKETYEVHTLDGKNLRRKRQQLLLKPYGMDEIHINKNTMPNRVEGLSLSLFNHITWEFPLKQMLEIKDLSHKNIISLFVVVVVEVEDLYGVSSVSITRAYEARIQSTGKFKEKIMLNKKLIEGDMFSVQVLREYQCPGMQ
ncbi:unnamed protein product [Lepeophtheirus salmonis]|uniref:(salmon louse) hypothetical protein n=1 Tax=Lepeophtheirus salmonis TaxID=72036 RepID=A0A817FFU4_LEPSM|nr:unnamed protein product [Lepeophtheirus salmonis]CAG9478347.1 unnamed protein product [Lepeophtheirus salmonis]